MFEPLDLLYGPSLCSYQQQEEGHTTKNFFLVYLRFCIEDKNIINQSSDYMTFVLTWLCLVIIIVCFYFLLLLLISFNHTFYATVASCEKNIIDYY